jgi:hypothetical protein
MSFLRKVSVAVGVALTGMALLTGCGRSATHPTVSVSGTVKYNGQPVSGGFIVFQNLQAGVTQSAPLGPDGKYSIPMIPPGEYQVFFSDPAPPGPEEAEAGATRQALAIPSKYKSASSSGLTAKVSNRDNTYDLDLKD